jgi:hypothetical protein
MIFCGVLSVLLVGSLALTQSSNLLDARSLCWNDALPAAEAGVEEAATHLHYCGATNLQSDSWTATNNQFTKTRLLDRGYYTVSVAPANPANPIQPFNPPVIYSTGYVQAPLVSGYVQRTVRVTTKLNYYFDYLILVKKSIDIGGASSMVDSFDSTDPTKSTNGQYDPVKAGDKARLACNSSLPACIWCGNGKVYGNLLTKFGGTAGVGSSGSVGDRDFVNSAAGRAHIQAGHWTNNLVASFPDVQPPFTAGAAMGPGTYAGTNYTYLVGDGSYYFPSNLSLALGQAMMVTGDATVYVTGSLTVNGGAFVALAPGARLTLYLGGPTASIGGGGVLNANGIPQNFSVFGLPTLTSAVYNGGAQFIGTIYAPEADWTLSGGSGTYGAIVANSVYLTGGMNLHYDESLASSNKPIFSLASWREL